MKRAATGSKPAGKSQTAKAPIKPTRPTKSRTAKQIKILEVKQEHPDLTVREIAAVADCSHPHVIETLKRYGIKQEDVKNYTTHRAAILQGLQARLLASVTEEDIKDASLLQRLSGYGILYDKERLETGKTTANIGTLVAHIEAIQRGESES